MGHCCAKRDFGLDEMCEIIDCLPEIKPSVSVDSMMGLVYIAGYTVGKDENGDNADDSHFYYNMAPLLIILITVVYIYLEIQFVSGLYMVTLCLMK